MTQQPKETSQDMVEDLCNKSNLFSLGAFPSGGVWKKHGFLLLSGSTVSLRVEVWMSLTLQDNDLLALITFLWGSQYIYQDSKFLGALHVL